MADVGRLKLDHPALDDPGGAPLHDQVEGMYKKISDSITGRYFEHTSFFNTFTVTFDHNFKMPFSELDFVIYESSSPSGGELTLLDQNDFTFAPTPGFLTTKVDVTNNSGAAVNYIAVIAQSAGGALTGAEIKALYEAEPNAYTDAKDTKLSGIETGATADQSDSEIKTAYENNSNTNAFTDANVTEQARLRTTIGTATLDSNMGPFTGTVLTDYTNIKANIQELGTAVDSNASKVSADGSVTTHSDVFHSGSGLIITGSERTHLIGIEENADVTDTANVTSALPHLLEGDLMYRDAGGALVRLPHGTEGQVITSVSGVPAYTDVSGQSIYDYVVDAGGNGDFTSLTNALLNVSSGTIFVKNGTYATDYSRPIKPGVHVVGESQAGVVIGTNSATVDQFLAEQNSVITLETTVESNRAIWDGTTGAGTASVTQGSTTVTLSQGSLGGSETGFLVLNGVEVYTIDSVSAPSTITLVEQYKGGTTSGLPFQLRTGDHTESSSVSNLTLLTGGARHGFHIKNASGVSIKNVTIKTQGTSGSRGAVYAENSFNCHFENIDIQNDRVSGSTGIVGVYFRSTWNCHVRNTSIRRCETALQLYTQTTPKVGYKNTFHLTEVSGSRIEAVNIVSNSEHTCSIHIEKLIHTSSSRGITLQTGGLNYCEITIDYAVGYSTSQSLINLSNATNSRHNRLHLGYIEGSFDPVVTVSSNLTGAERNVITRGTIKGELTVSNTIVGSTVLADAINGWTTVFEDSFVTDKIPLTTNGDLLTQASGVLDRIAAGGNDQVLTIDTGAPIWKDLPPTPPTGQVLYDVVVDAAGNGDYTSVFSAVATEPAGTTFYVRNGTYNETTNTISIKENQHLIGESRDGVIIQGSSAIIMQYFSKNPTSDRSDLLTDKTGWDAAAGDGTATVTFNSTTVTLSTAALGGGETGYIVLNGCDAYEISSVSAPSTVTLATPFQGSGASNVPYLIKTGSHTDRASVSNLTLEGTAASTGRGLYIYQSSGFTASNLLVKSITTVSSHALVLFNEVYNCHLNNVEMIAEDGGAGFYGQGFKVEGAVNCTSKNLVIARTTYGCQLRGGTTTGFNNKWHISNVTGTKSQSVRIDPEGMFRSKIEIDNIVHAGQGEAIGATTTGGVNFSTIKADTIFSHNQFAFAVRLDTTNQGNNIYEFGSIEAPNKAGDIAYIRNQSGVGRESIIKSGIINGDLNANLNVVSGAVMADAITGAAQTNGYVY